MYSIGQFLGDTIWLIFWTGVSKERKGYWTHLIFLTDIHSSWNPDEIDGLHSFWSSILFHLLGFWDPGTVWQYCALGDTHDWTRTSHTLYVRIWELRPIDHGSLQNKEQFYQTAGKLAEIVWSSHPVYVHLGTWLNQWGTPWGARLA